MKWIELAVTVERVVIDEVTTLFDTFTENGVIEEDVENHPEWVQLTVYGDADDTEETLEAKIRQLLGDNHIEIKRFFVKCWGDPLIHLVEEHFIGVFLFFFGLLSIHK